MNHNRKLTLDKKFTPFPTFEGDELYNVGIFCFSITGIQEHIMSGKLAVEKEKINVKEWFKTHTRGSVNEEYLPTVDPGKPVLQAEISPGMYDIILTLTA